MSKVLVTGGSGFLGSHCIVQLLAAGHEVRTTIRNLSKGPQVRAIAQGRRADLGDQLIFHAADLSQDDGWADAIARCDFVLHVASPFPVTQPKDENELIVPARDGALRVLRLARDAGVKRVVLTSSFAAVGYGRAQIDRPYTEEDWTETDAPNEPYIKSKTIAERAAWDFIAREGGALEFCVINPTGIFGPLLGPDYPASLALIKAMLDGDMPELPDFSFGVVDARDAANLHLLAMTHPEANGQRFLGVAGPAVSMSDVAQILHTNLGPAAARVSHKIVPRLGKNRNASNVKATRVLGWSPRSTEDALIASAQSLIDFGLVGAAPKAVPPATT